MAKPKKQTVDYFPHDCIHKKTIFILEQKYDVYGYTFWFKLLEVLGSTPNHYYNCSDQCDWEYLIAKTLIKDETKAKEILNLLAELNAIDKELWFKSKIIWSQNFVNRLKDLYVGSRHADLPQRPKIITTPDLPPDDYITTPDNTKNDLKQEESTPDYPQIKLNEIKVNQINNIPDTEPEEPEIEELDGSLDDTPAAVPTVQDGGNQVKKSKHPEKDVQIHNQIKSYFIEKHGKFYNYARESEGIYRLIKYARQDAPGLHEFDFVKAATEEFNRMKIAGHDLFTGKPCLPSMVASQGLWPFVIESMKQHNLIRGSPVNGETAEEYYKRTMEGVFKTK